METPNAIGFVVTLLAIVGVACAYLWQQFASRVFVPVCNRCRRHHSPTCAGGE